MELKPSSHIPNEFCYQEPHKGLLLFELAGERPTTNFYRQILLSDPNLCQYYLVEGFITREPDDQVCITVKGREFLLQWQAKNKQHHASSP